MKNAIIWAGAAALAFAAPVLAQPGKGGGNGGGGNKGGGAPAKGERGGGGGPQQQARGGGGQQQARGGGGPQRLERGGGPQRVERGGGSQQQVRGNDRGQVRAERRAERQQPRVDRGPARQVRETRGSVQRGSAKRETTQRGSERREVRADNRRSVEQRSSGGVDNRLVTRDQRSDARILRSGQRADYFTSPSFRTTGLVDGCPPGLAAKGNGCLPPGQARKLVGAAFPAALGSALLPPLYRSWYPDNDDYFYRTQNDYVYRIDRDQNNVDAYWPIADQWNGAYYVGATYPQDYLGYYNVPVQYQPWYADNDESYYRYGDGAIYQVDRNGGVIESIVSLLAGGVGIGQPLPAGYDVYNVPYDYRDRYVDSADSMYRYNDGHIYQVDPTTRLVEAIVETLV